MTDESYRKRVHDGIFEAISAAGRTSADVHISLPDVIEAGCDALAAIALTAGNFMGPEFAAQLIDDIEAGMSGRLRSMADGIRSGEITFAPESRPRPRLVE